jgi:hypothetical protein
MTWALKRQIFYVLVVLVFLLGVGYLITYPRFHLAPSCVDGKQNGNETGIDCGGSCARACTAEVNPISVLWSRSFRVLPGRYNAVAYLENKNDNLAVYKIKYRFRFADKDNLYIGKREGETFIPTSGKFAIFESAIDMGNSIPVYTTFEFTEAPVWVKVSPQKVNQLKVFVSDVRLDNETTNPKLSAMVKNNSLFNIPNMNVVTILYDAQGTALSASQTYLDSLKGGESLPVNFTWPEPIQGGVVTKEIIPLFNIFLVQLN